MLLVFYSEAFIDLYNLFCAFLSHQLNLYYYC
jgi:hypothetical protein